VEESPFLPLDPQRTLLVFQLPGRLAAVPFENVERIVPMAQLAHPPGLPSPLEGILNLGGRPVPVLRLDRLLQLPERPPGLYSMLIVLKGISDGRIAMLVDRVIEILAIPESALLPIGEEQSFNACAEAVVSVRDQMVHLLSPARILLEKEREALSGFQAMAQRRLQDWEPHAL
jgi:purine-binding chemotaxis protein CheW